MATFYLDSYVGVTDGTKVPADKANAQKVGANRVGIWGAKPAGQALAVGDLLFLGRLRAGESVREINVITDTSLATTTINVGTLTNATKYASAKTVTTTDVPVGIGPRGVQAVVAPLAADEDIYAQIGVAGIAGAVNLAFDLVLARVK